MTAQQAYIERLRIELAAATSKTLEASSEASNKLDRIMAEEKARSDVERQHMLDRITALINANAKEDHKRLDERISVVRGDINSSRQEFANANADYNQRLMDWTASEDAYLNELISNRENLKTKMVQDWKRAEEYSERIQTTTQAVHAHNTKLVDEQIEKVDDTMQVLDGFVTSARAENENHYERFTTIFGTLSQNVSEFHSTMSTQVDEMRVDAEEFGKDMGARVDSLKQSTGTFEVDAERPLSLLRSHILESKFAEYRVTAGTPRKRSYNYPNKLPRTEPHEVILTNLRKNQERRGRFGFSPTPKLAISTTISQFGAVEEEFKSGDTTPVDGDIDQQIKEVGDEILSPASTHVLSPEDATVAASPAILSREASPVQTATDTINSEPLINSSINTHTFTQHDRRKVPAIKSGKGSTLKGLKELNPNVDVGTYRTGITPASAVQSTTGTSLDLQPPLKKQTVEKKLRGRIGKGKDWENNVPSVRRRGATGGNV